MIALDVKPRCWIMFKKTLLWLYKPSRVGAVNNCSSFLHWLCQETEVRSKVKTLIGSPGKDFHDKDTHSFFMNLHLYHIYIWISRWQSTTVLTTQAIVTQFLYSVKDDLDQTGEASYCVAVLRQRNKAFCILSRHTASAVETWYLDMDYLSGEWWINFTRLIPVALIIPLVLLPGLKSLQSSVSHGCWTHND